MQRSNGYLEENMEVMLGLERFSSPGLGKKNLGRKRVQQPPFKWYEIFMQNPFEYLGLIKRHSWNHQKIYGVLKISGVGAGIKVH